MLRRAFGLAVLLCAVCGFARAEELLPPDRPVEQVIDHYIAAELKAANIRPAAPADAATILRRLTLDLNGRIPTSAEVAEYTASTDPDKKTKLVDRLIASPAFSRYHATELLNLVQPEEAGRRGNARGPLRDFLLAGVKEDRRWDRVFRDLILPDDADPAKKGAGEYLKARVKDLNKLTIDVSSTFFGVNISCAQCHDHPHVHDWTQDHFYGMKSFFARTFEKNGVVAEYDAGFVKYLPNKGKEKVAPVMFLSGKKLDVPNLREPTKEEKKQAQDRVDKAKKEKKPAAPPAYSVRAKFVETALEPGQREFFARSIANRLFHRFLGRGLVMPLDQMHSENPPSHPQLLAWLERDLIAHGYDLRRVVRGIVLSEAYARGSRYEGEGPPLDKYFAVAAVRPLTPSQMATSLRVATADPQSLPADRAELEKRIEALEKSGEKYASLFPYPADGFQVSVSEAMLFANNEALQKELLAGAGTLTARMKEIASPEQKADLAIRSVLSRAGRPEEIAAITDYLQRRADRPDAAYQQVVWALLTSAEFRFNH